MICQCFSCETSAVRNGAFDVVRKLPIPDLKTTKMFALLVAFALNLSVRLKGVGILYGNTS